MPLYEYICPEDGEVIELLRSMAEADDPVADPSGKHRKFQRVLSTFSPKEGSIRPVPTGGGCCPCGRTPGSCSAS